MNPVTVITLTATGRELAMRLHEALPGAEFLHQPEAFTATVQQRFTTGHRLVLVCATGIAVRALAPVLGSKHRDPPVLVIDERGEYVIPLLSGHEGGGNNWGQRLADTLGARCVITGARRYTGCELVAGLGCERGCPAGLLAGLMDDTLAAHGLHRDQLTALASIDLKRDEAGLLALAGELKLTPGFYGANQLERYHHRLSVRSEIVFQATGCYGVAEAAALAHAEQLSGQQAELLITKRKGPRATFALARAYRD